MKNLKIGLHISQILKNNLIGCDTFPNGLVWFHLEAKPIWEKFQRQCQHAVICYIWL